MILTCGHEPDDAHPKGIPLVYKDYTCDAVDGYVKCTTHSVVCDDCYRKWVDDHLEDMIFDETEEEEWLS